MSVEQLSHPPLDRLTSFALGKLEVAEIDDIENHLSRCDSCCQTLRQIHEDTFTGAVRDSHRAVPPSVGSAPTIAPSEIVEQPAPPTDSATAGFRAAGASGPIELPADLAQHPRYRVQELLGAGGMGAVYKAEHRLMHRTVALKVINPELVASRTAVERFQREVQAAARLHHPNIVTAHDAEQAGASHFLVMEFVPGIDLARVVAERGPLPVAEACDYIRQAALGLQHAMENGMVHRDIKPQNLMVTNSASGGREPPDHAALSGGSRFPLAGVVKILDFGLASLAAEPEASEDNQDSRNENQKSSLTQAGALMGTPDYMAPEQARDARSADIRADIYSLGCTLYFLLTGKVPFPGGSAIDKVIAHAERKPDEIRKLRRDVPAGVLAVLDQMLAKKPEQRYQSPAAIAAALAPFTTIEKHPPLPRAVTIAADLLMVASVFAALVAIGVFIWLHFEAASLSFEVDRELQLIAGLHLLYAGCIFTAGWLMRQLTGRFAAALLIAVAGILLPGVCTVNVVMEWSRMPRWPLIIPLWLGVPLCVWAMLLLSRSNVHATFAENARRSGSRRRRLAGLGWAAACALVFGGIVYVNTKVLQSCSWPCQNGQFRSNSW